MEQAKNMATSETGQTKTKWDRLDTAEIEKQQELEEAIKLLEANGYKVMKNETQEDQQKKIEAAQALVEEEGYTVIPPTAESSTAEDSAVETAEQFQSIPDLEYNDVKNFNAQQLKKYVNNLVDKAKTTGNYANRVENLDKLEGQVAEVQDRIEVEAKQAQNDLDAEQKRLEQAQQNDPTAAPDRTKLNELEAKVKDYERKDKYLDKAGNKIMKEKMINHFQVMFAERAVQKGETEQQCRAEAQAIGACVTSGQEAYQANRLGALSNMSYADVYKQVLENKTAGRKRIIGPINRLMARYQTNQIVKDMNRSGMAEGNLMMGNSASRRAAREASERQIKADKAAVRASQRFGQFS